MGARSTSIFRKPQQTLSLRRSAFPGEKPRMYY
jgi:hypothetical protein